MGLKFQCPECEYQGTRKSHIVTHQRSVHMVQKFQCPECEDQATQKGDLVHHQQFVDTRISVRYAPLILAPAEGSSLELLTLQPFLFSAHMYKLPMTN